MRLNLLNQTVLMSSAILSAKLIGLNPRFGVTSIVNDKVFKFADTGDNRNAVLVERVDLGELFDKIPQDITGFTFTDALGDPTNVQALLGVDMTRQEYPVIPFSLESQAPEDELGTFFSQWTRVVGLNDLKRHEVELSSSEDYLIVNARNAVLFKGTVQIKIK